MLGEPLRYIVQKIEFFPDDERIDDAVGSIWFDREGLNGEILGIFNSIEGSYEKTIILMNCPDPFPDGTFKSLFALLPDRQGAKVSQAEMLHSAMTIAVGDVFTVFGQAHGTPSSGKGKVSFVDPLFKEGIESTQARILRSMEAQMTSTIKNSFADSVWFQPSSGRFLYDDQYIFYQVIEPLISTGILKFLCFKDHQGEPMVQYKLAKYMKSA